MIVYQADKRQFLHDNDHGSIDDVIYDAFRKKTGKKVAQQELRSWRNSLGHVARVLRDDGIPQETGVAVEFHIPQSSKRIDVTLTGHDARDRKKAIVVELKQWEEAEATDKDAIVKSFIGKGNRETVHPSYQAWSYASLLEGFNEAVYDGGIALHPCAYLHNYRRDGEIDAPAYAHYIDKAPLFLKGDAETEKLRAFIKRHIKRGDSRKILFEMENGRIRPSKALADSLVGMLRGNQEFVLIDEQKTVYEAALAAGAEASRENPRVMIVEGGPGTGKTVVAINLLTALTAKGLVCKYVSKNAAPRAVYQAKLTGTMRKTKFASLFSGSGAFTETPKDEFDVLIVDEAHRLNERSGLYQNMGEDQTKELINSAKCTIFFLDENQRVTRKDVGSRERVEKYAAEKGASVEVRELSSQFRCGGSDAYLAWLDHTLGVRETANATLSAKDFAFKVFDSPEELHAEIEARNSDNKARMVAGYCWEWASKTKPKAYDITIGENYRKRWNLGSYGSLWIIDPHSVSEVGCIHTCQGLELDYVGVIIGPDFVVRDGRVRTVPAARAKQDQSLKGHLAFSKIEPEKAMAEADGIIKSTYRTLMSRGMKGCYIYCTDPETAQHFRDALE